MDPPDENPPRLSLFSGAWASLGLLGLAVGAGVIIFIGFGTQSLRRETGGSGRSTPPAAVAAPTPTPSASTPQESKIRAMRKHPELARAGSTLNVKFVAAYRKLETEKSPLLQQPDWPEKLADQCAAPTAVSELASALAALNQPQAAGEPFSRPAAPAVAPVPQPSPSALPFVTMEAVNKGSGSSPTYTYNADSETSDVNSIQSAAIDIQVRNLGAVSVTLIVRWAFIARYGRSNKRFVYAAEGKRLTLAAGQTDSETATSPLIGNRAVADPISGSQYVIGYMYDGWVVQLSPEGSEKVLRQVGSNGPIEDLAQQPDFIRIMKRRAAPAPTPSVSPAAP